MITLRGVITPNFDTTTANIVCNGVVSTHKSKYVFIYIIIKYLGTPLIRYEYLCIYITLIIDKIIHKYNVLSLFRNGFIYLDICKFMYEFPPAGPQK